MNPGRLITPAEAVEITRRQMRNAEEERRKVAIAEAKISLQGDFDDIIDWVVQFKCGGCQQEWIVRTAFYEEDEFVSKEHEIKFCPKCGGRNISKIV